MSGREDGPRHFLGPRAAQEARGLQSSSREGAPRAFVHSGGLNAVHRGSHDFTGDRPPFNTRFSGQHSDAVERRGGLDNPNVLNGNVLSALVGELGAEKRHSAHERDKLALKEEGSALEAFIRKPDS